MRHLKKFENFDFQKEEEELVVPADVVNNEEGELCPDCNCKPCECEDENLEDGNEEDAGADEDNLRLEKFSTFNEKKEMSAKQKAIFGKKSDKKDDKKTTTKKGEKPDFLDVDKDGDKKESMKKASKDSKEKEGEKGGKKGLTAGQKKLPEAMQKAILKKQK